MREGIKLYYLPGTCALAVSIVFEWAKIDHESIRMERADLKSDWYLKINPQGVVPTIEKSDGHLSEVAAILLDISDECPELTGEAKKKERGELYFWLNFLSGTLHPHYWLFFNPHRFTMNEDKKAHQDIKLKGIELVKKDLCFIEEHLGKTSFLLGETHSIVDALLFPMARWGYMFEGGTADFPNLDKYIKKLLQDKGVTDAMKVHDIGMPKYFDEKING